MTEKLTLEDCYKYPKARIKADTKDFKNVFTFTIYSFNSNLSSNQILREENCKLILRDISQLTDEEKRHIDKKFLPIVLDTEETINLPLKDSMNFIEYNLIIEFIDHLRSINIDIDNFIKSGKAVKDV